MSLQAVHWAADQDEFASVASGILANLLRSGREISLALPTGQTPIGLYRQIVGLCRKGDVSFARTRLFNLDEYLGASPDTAESYHAFLHHHLIDHIDIPASRVRLLRGDTADPAAECRSYDQAIEAAGGIDMAILGLGANGHIAFNEPGSSWNSQTHVIRLAAQTRAAHRPDFSNADAVPRFGITMGIATILQAKKIMLLCAGKGKEQALSMLLAGQGSSAWPVTSLIGHPDLTIVAQARLRGSQNLQSPAGQNNSTRQAIGQTASRL